MKTAVVALGGGSDYGEPESQAKVSRLDLAMNEELLRFLSREGDDRSPV